MWKEGMITKPQFDYNNNINIYKAEFLTMQLNKTYTKYKFE